MVETLMSTVKGPDTPRLPVECVMFFECDQRHHQRCVEVTTITKGPRVVRLECRCACHRKPMSEVQP